MLRGLLRACSVLVAGLTWGQDVLAFWQAAAESGVAQNVAVDKPYEC